MAQRMIEMRQDVLARQRARAEEFRRARTAEGTLVVHLMSSPGAGKTALLEATARHWAGHRSLAVLVGDLATERDADRIRPLAPAAQLTTGGACHLEIPLVERGFAELPPRTWDYLFIEDVGNLVCPASHDVGHHLRVILWSVTEGDDKAGKYPKAFRTSQAVVITKLDLLPYVPFDVAAALDDARAIQPQLTCLELSARANVGVETWLEFLEAQRQRLLSDAAAKPVAQDATGAARAAVDGLRIELRGQVQGLGVRPALARLAHELKLAGAAANTSAGVALEVAGPADAVAEFTAGFAERLPAGARLESWSREPLAHQEACHLAARGDFSIGSPEVRTGLAAPLPRDRAICADCLADAVDRDDPRRSGYPFVSCTACGPRYALLRAMPYDRSHTSLAGFSLCPSCAAEFGSSVDRRFHAETNACAICGPQVRLIDRQGRLVAGPWRARVAAALAAGEIVALLGVGGYQLLCDATNSAAVRGLRQRKGRPSKPLAVMVRDLAMAEGLAVLDEAHRRTLAEPANAIVLAPPRPGTGLAHGELLAGLGEVGLLLPTTALHALVARDFGRPLVCTSGNRDGEPLAYRPETAGEELEALADLRLDHDRAVLQPIDDSLVRIIAGRPVTLRLGRGLGPHPLTFPRWLTDHGRALPCLALGGHQKNALAWWNGEQAVLGPHVGDLDTMATRRRLAERIDTWQALYRFRPERLICDAHPDYASTRHAEAQALPLTRVQHHRAHLAASCAEHGLENREVAGVVWDGTGWGDDDSVWGGEFFRGTVDNLARVGHLRPFRLAGGEAAIREPARVAVALLAEAGESLAGTPLGTELDPAWVGHLEPLLSRPRMAPATTSAGRLFDGLAALVWGPAVAGFEGRPAMLLESAVDPAAPGNYALAWTPSDDRGVAELDWRPLVRGVVGDLRRGEPAGHVAMRIHRALAAAIVTWAARQPGCPLVLSGGVFQNRWLTELILDEWRNLRRSEPVWLPGVIPPNDGGLAAGQLVLGLLAAKPNHQEL